MDRLKKDTVAKKLMGRSDIFASVFNYYLYGGRQVIRSEDLSELSIEELIVGRNGADRGLRDLLKSAVLKKDSGAQYLFLGIENQSSIDPFMVLRIIHYDVLSYLRQLKSRGRKEKLIPTITIIFNCSGRPWKKKLSLYDILDIPEELREFFESYCGNHTIYVLDPYSMEEAELEKLERDLMLVTKGMKNHNNKDRYYSFLRSSEMSDVDDIVFDAIKVFNDDMNLEPIRNEKGKIDMCKASEELRKDFIAEGRAEGLMEGRAKGRAEAVMAAMKNFNLTAEEAMAGLEIPEEDRDGILRLLKNKI